jgi:iron complex outermembrane receptor protein
MKRIGRKGEASSQYRSAAKAQQTARFHHENATQSLLSRRNPAASEMPWHPIPPFADPSTRGFLMLNHRMSPTLLALALGMAFPMQAAVAQTAAEAKKDVSQLEAVIVTGSRRAENLKEVPQSISAIKSEELDTYNASGQDIRALSGKVPSLNIESDYGRTFPRFYVRGLGNTDFDMNASQPVGLVYDDVVQESIALKGFPVFDMEQVELLRGPQGTLFGRNSPAGVMKFDSVKPGISF